MMSFSLRILGFLVPAFGCLVFLSIWTGNAAAQNHCLQINHLIGSGYTQLRNYCDERISVHWNDQNYCSTGCMESIAANDWNSATLWQGHTNYCVCFGYDYCC